MPVTRILSIALLGFLPLATLPAGAGTIIATADATVHATPDMAVIMLGVERQGRTADAALADNSASMTALLDVLKTQGIAPADIQTQGLTLEPQYAMQSNSGPAQISGYVARNQVNVTIRDLPALGPILDQVVKAGGNQFYGLSFSVQDSGPLADQALADAVRNAAAKAAIMADAAGVMLGPITDIRQSGGYMPPVPMMREASFAMDAVPVSEGSVGITASVTLTYEFSQP